MKKFFSKLIGKGQDEIKLDKQDLINRQVTALYGLLADVIGSEKLVLKAGKLDALEQNAFRKCRGKSTSSAKDCTRKSNF